MKDRTLGTDLVVSAIGLGCMGMSHAYGSPADDDQMIELIHDAFKLGCTFFDTAEVYGTADDPHMNETLVGKALKLYRDEVVVATKFGIHFDLDDGKVNHGLVPDARPDSIRRSLEGSLERLQTDRIDLYYQHRQDPNVPVDVVAETMCELIEEGLITHWGLSEVDEDTIRRAHAVCPVTAIQNRYSMMARWYEPLFPALEELHIGFVAFSPLANGFLTGAYSSDSKFEEGTDYRSVMPQFSAQGFEKNKELLELLKNLGTKHKATPAQISLAWMLAKRPFIVPIPGTRKLSRLKENFGATCVKLNAQEVLEIDEALSSLEMSEVFGGSSIKK